MRTAWTTERLAQARALREGGADYPTVARRLAELWGQAVSAGAVRLALKAAAPGQDSSPVQERPASESVGQAPAIHTGRARAENYLAISDLQIPFEHPNALLFVERVRRAFSVPKENMLCVGDEVDQYFGSLYDHSPDAEHTPNSELKDSLERLRRWYAAFPQMRVAKSNHGLRWAKKAAHAQIPSQMLRAYQEILEAPPGWRWADHWDIPASRHPFRLHHGHQGASGIYAARTQAIDLGRSVVFGHLHSNAGVSHVVTAGQHVWGLNTGCLIDRDAYAFQYGRDSRFKPTLGLGVILDGGTTPIFVPYG